VLDNLMTVLILLRHAASFISIALFHLTKPPPISRLMSGRRMQNSHHHPTMLSGKHLIGIIWQSIEINYATADELKAFTSCDANNMSRDSGVLPFPHDRQRTPY
jgi:hypothetical protein